MSKQEGMRSFLSEVYSSASDIIDEIYRLEKLCFESGLNDCRPMSSIRVQHMPFL